MILYSIPLIDLYLMMLYIRMEEEGVTLIHLSLPAFFIAIFLEVFISWKRGSKKYRINDTINSLSCGVVSFVNVPVLAIPPIRPFYSSSPLLYSFSEQIHPYSIPFTSSLLCFGFDILFLIFFIYFLFSFLTVIIHQKY